MTTRQSWRTTVRSLIGLISPPRQVFRKLKYRRSAPEVWFFPGTKVFNCRFEGYNALRSGVKLSDSTMGEGTYINSGSSISGARIGRYCSVGEEVKIGFGNHPTRGFVSTSGLLLADTSETLGFTLHRGGDLFPFYRRTADGAVVSIGNDVWIGARAMILDGITIGDGAVIGAGAVVTRDVEPYTIVAGVPARPLRKRFTEEQIGFLLEFRWWDRGVDWVTENYREMDDIESFMKKYGG